MLVVMLIQSGLTFQGRGVRTFYTLGGSCNFNLWLCNLVPRALPNLNTERKALKFQVDISIFTRQCPTTTISKSLSIQRYKATVCWMSVSHQGLSLKFMQGVHGYYHYSSTRQSLVPPMKKTQNVTSVGEALQGRRQLLAVFAAGCDYKSTCKSAVLSVFRMWDQ